MKKRSIWIGLLLNALVWPGTGQLYFNHRKKGLIFAGFFLALLLAMITRIATVLFAVLNLKSFESALQIDPHKLLLEISSLDRNILGGFSIGLILIWVLSLLDIVINSKREES